MIRLCGSEVCGGVKVCKACTAQYHRQRRARLKAMPQTAVDPSLPVLDVDEEPIAEVIEIEMVGPPVKPDYVPQGIWDGLTEVEKQMVHRRTPVEHEVCRRIFAYLEGLDTAPRCSACGQPATHVNGRLWRCAKH